MDRWKAAARRYERFKQSSAPLPASEINGFRVWLEDDVVPLLTDLTRLPRFRSKATWSRRTLVFGTASTERGLIEQVDHCLVTTAKALIEAFNHPGLKKCVGIEKPVPNLETRIRSGTSLIGNTGRPRTKLQSTRGESDPLRTSGIALEMNSVRSIAGRDWQDLVCAEDFFSTRQEFVQGADGTWLQRGELINSLNQRIYPICDLVAQGLRHRIDVRQKSIQSLHNRLLQITSTNKLTHVVAVKNAIAEEKELQAAISRLHLAVFTNSDAMLRDSCVVMTQIYAAIHPTPELDWLEIDETLIKGHQSRFLSLLNGHRGNDVLDRIACSCGDMDQLYENVTPRQAQLEAAIAGGGLVIDYLSKDAWWEQNRITFQRRSKNWDFLAKLAEMGRHNSCVGETDLYPKNANSTSESTMANRRSRLCTLLPGSLSLLITPGKKPRTYQLNLPSDRIALIR